jgi:hypothetical protein
MFAVVDAQVLDAIFQKGCDDPLSATASTLEIECK